METEIKKIISQQFGNDWKIKDIKEIPGGFKSKAYRITVDKNGDEKKLFLKHTISKPSGFYENNIDKLSSYLLSQQTAELANTAPRPLGVFLSQNNQVMPIATLKENDIVFQLQEFREGHNFFEYLLDNDTNSDFIKNSKKIIDQIIKKITSIHNKKPAFSVGDKKLLYKKSLRNTITNPELALAMIEDNIEGSLFEGEFRYEYIIEMLKVAEYFWGNYERISLLHGDFWPGNIIFEKNGVWFFDYSRYGYGDPGVDVGHFYLSMIILSIWRKNEKYLELGKYFLQEYLAHTQDEFILQSAVIPYGQVGAVFILDKFFPGTEKEDRKKFAQYIIDCMKNKKILIDYNS